MSKCNLLASLQLFLEKLITVVLKILDSWISLRKISEFLKHGANNVKVFIDPLS